MGLGRGVVGEVVDEGDELAGEVTDESAERCVGGALDREHDVFKARGIDGRDGPGLEDLIRNDDELVEVGVVVVQPAGYCDEGVG